MHFHLVILMVYVNAVCLSLEYVVIIFETMLH